MLELRQAASALTVRLQVVEQQQQALLDNEASLAERGLALQQALSHVAELTATNQQLQAMLLPDSTRETHSSAGADGGANALPAGAPSKCGACTGTPARSHVALSCRGGRLGR